MTQPWAPIIVPPQLDGRVLTYFLDLLTKLDVDYLREHPETPSIYRSGVRYIPEPPGHEQWLAVPGVLAMGGSVCHSLACWRTAELIVRGEPARAKWSSVQRPDGSMLYHIRVLRGPNTRSAQYPQGRIEDPSAALGMENSNEVVQLMGPVHHDFAVAGLDWH